MNKKVNVHFILDKSGSMLDVQSATISGFNEYIATLKKDKKNDYNMTLTLFDAVVQEKYKKEALKKIEQLDQKSYAPDGMTALYDAVCQTLKGIKEDKEKNLVVIMTDGEENSSKEYTEKNFQDLVGELKDKKNWTFVFLGANQDSWLKAGKWGFDKNNVANFVASARGMNTAMNTLAQSTVCFANASSFTSDTFFNEEQKKELEEVV